MNLQTFFETVDRLFAEKRAAEAERFMKESLAEAEAEENAAAITAICSELGGYYRAVSDYAAGIPLYEKALNLIEQLGENGSAAHGTTLINFATMYTVKGEPAKALNLYQQAEAIFSGPAFARDYRLAALYNNMSLACQDTGNPLQAETYLHKALSILETLSGSEIEIAVTCTNLAGLCALDHRTEEAEMLLKKACRIFLKERGGQDVHYAAAVCALGDLAYDRKDFEEASSRYEETLRLIERDYGKDNDNYRTVAEKYKLAKKASQS